MHHITDQERRRRIALRHRLHPSARAGSPEEATAAMTVLHATEPATVYLSTAARLDAPDRDDLDRALFVGRTLVKQLAMRRTLFVFPRDLLPAAWGSASARVAATERTRLIKDVEANFIADDGSRWLQEAAAAVLGRLSNGEGVSAANLREELPQLAGRLNGPAGKAYAVSAPVGPRVLTVLAAEGVIVRGDNEGHWRVSRPAWTRMESWLGERPTPLDPTDGYAELVRRWLGTFGPGTEADLVWWLGSTKAAVRTALARIEAVEVTLDGPSTTGWVLPDDLAETPDPGHWVALLPVLDPTVMGWKQRGFYLGEHAPFLFDRNGNAGTTVWVDGRIVGCWVQNDQARVQIRLLEEVSARSRHALDLEAERLTAWLAGERVGTVYPSPAMKSGA